MFGCLGVSEVGGIDEARDTVPVLRYNGAAYVFIRPPG